MKKILLVLMLGITTFTFLGCEKTKDEDGKIIGISNDESSVLQVKVIIEKINIRKNTTTKSEILGIVQENSIFDVIDYTTDENYIWIKIKTNNNIEGYIASEKLDPYLEFLNGFIDYEKPTINIKQEQFQINTRNDLNLEYIKSIGEYSDNSNEFEITYNINYDNETSSRKFPITIEVKDKSSNVSTKEIYVEFLKEKKLSNGTWINYDEFYKIKNSLKSACSKYAQYAEIECISYDLIWDLFFNSEFLEVRTSSNRETFCEYNIENFQVANCYESGNIIPYQTVEDKIKINEEKSISEVKEILKTFKNDGYELKDMKW